MPKKHRFFDELLSTPVTDSRPTMSNNLHQIPERLSDIEVPLVTHSFHLETSTPNPSRAAEQLRRERSLAADSLNRISSIGPRDLTSLPSKYLRHTEDSSRNSQMSFFTTESTISESDLLQPDNSSTPRESILSNLECVMKEPTRGSRGQSLANLGHSLRNPQANFDKVMENFCKTMDLGFDGTYCAGEKAVKMFEQDEEAWEREKHIPAKLQEFSMGLGGVDSKISVGSFFKERSDDLSSLLAKSPTKAEQPVPLIDVSNFISHDDESIDMKSDSLSVSAIAKLLSDTKQTPHRLVDFFTKNKKSPRKSLAFGDITEEKDSRSPSPTLSNRSDDSNEESSKENRDTSNVKENYPEKSSISSRSSSALSHLPNGKLPIGTTKSELIWGCIKPGKTSSQELVIKNKSPSRIGFKCIITNPSFRLIKEGSECTNSLKVNLHAFESRTLTIVFAPISEGAAFDMINFIPMDPNHSQVTKQFIRLFGYGGHGNITLNNVYKDTAGKFVLSLGNVVETGTMERVFTVKNTGTLPSFAYLGFVSNVLNLFTSVKVSQETIVLLPNQETQVVVTCELKKQELQYIQSKRNSSVIDIGKVTLIHGTEVDRGRLRRLCLKAKEKGLAVEPAMEGLTAKFPGEAMPNDLKHLKEATASKDEIIRLFNNKEITVTIEQDLDSTVVGQFPNETASFVSLCENTVLENTVFSALYTVEPTDITITPPFKVTDMIFITNSSRKEAYFEVLSVPKGLHLKPREGTVPVGKTEVVEVCFKEIPTAKTVYKIKVLIDNEVYEVDVKINTVRGFKA